MDQYSVRNPPPPPFLSSRLKTSSQMFIPPIGYLLYYDLTRNCDVYLLSRKVVIYFNKFPTQQCMSEVNGSSQILADPLDNWLSLLWYYTNLLPAGLISPGISLDKCQLKVYIVVYYRGIIVPLIKCCYYLVSSYYNIYIYQFIREFVLKLMQCSNYVGISSAYYLSFPCLLILLKRIRLYLCNCLLKTFPVGVITGKICPVSSIFFNGCSILTVQRQRNFQLLNKKPVE